MPKQTLTHAIIKKYIAGTDANRAKIFIRVCVAIMFVIGIICATFSILLSLFIIALCVLMLVLSKRADNTVNKIRSKNYMIYKETCYGKGIEKDVSSDSATTETCYLEISHFKRSYLNFPGYKASPKIFESTEIGDSLYVVTDENHQILFLFNCKYWELDLNEFTKSDNRFIPNK